MMQRRVPSIGVSVLFPIGFIGFLVYLTRTFFDVIGDPALSLLYAHEFFAL